MQGDDPSSTILAEVPGWSPFFCASRTCSNACYRREVQSKIKKITQRNTSPMPRNKTFVSVRIQNAQPATISI